MFRSRVEKGLYPDGVKGSVERAGGRGTQISRLRSVISEA